MSIFIGMGRNGIPTNIGGLGHDRLRTWFEGGKRGRMFIYFVGLILA